MQGGALINASAALCNSSVGGVEAYDGVVYCVLHQLAQLVKKLYPAEYANVLEEQQRQQLQQAGASRTEAQPAEPCTSPSLDEQPMDQAPSIEEIAGELEMVCTLLSVWCMPSTPLPGCNCLNIASILSSQVCSGAGSPRTMPRHLLTVSSLQVTMLHLLLSARISPRGRGMYLPSVRPSLETTYTMGTDSAQVLARISIVLLGCLMRPHDSVMSRLGDAIARLQWNSFQFTSAALSHLAPGTGGPRRGVTC